MTTKPDALAELAAVDPKLKEIMELRTSQLEYMAVEVRAQLLTRLAQAHAREREARVLLTEVSHSMCLEEGMSGIRLRAQRWLATSKTQ